MRATSHRPSALAVFVALCAMVPVQSVAQGFAALVSPPRFELKAKAGDKLREVVEITNASAQAARYRFKTAEWKLDENAAASFDETLAAGSCRPWVAIESRQVTVPPGGKYRYRIAPVVSDPPVIAGRLAEITGRRPEEFSEQVLLQMIRLMRRDLRAGIRIVYDEPENLLRLYARATLAG